MRVSVFGLGYIGSVTAACLARDGHTVIGADVECQRIAHSNRGRSLILEPGLDHLITEGESLGKLHITVEARSAVLGSDVSIICVGTSSNANGTLDLQELDRVCVQIGTALAVKQDYHVVVLRTAVLPGTVEGRLKVLLEQHSNRQAGADFGIAMNPATLREGKGIEDFDHPSHIVIGELDARSGDRAQLLYKAINAPIIRTSIQTAEMLNYVNNAFHAVKVTFANEIGSLCAAHGIDGHEVMEYLCMDRRLNISPAYLRPGFAFGGPYLPKDLRALGYRAKEQDVDCPLLSAVLPSNQKQISRAIELVERTRKSKIGILGLGFKAGPDICDNPTIRLVEALIGKGYELRIFASIGLAQPGDASDLFPDRGQQHIVRLIRSSLEEVIRESEVLVIANADSAVRRVPELLLEGQILIDLAGVTRGMKVRVPGVPVILKDGNTRESICN